MLTVVDDMGETVLVGNSNSFLSSIKPSVKKQSQLRNEDKNWNKEYQKLVALNFPHITFEIRKRKLISNIPNKLKYYC